MLSKDGISVMVQSFLAKSPKITLSFAERYFLVSQCTIRIHMGLSATPREFSGTFQKKGG